MTVTKTSFERDEAPCGKMVDGHRQQERDDHILLADNKYYSCGCYSIRRSYHDGSFCRRVIHHNGTVIVDELFHR